MINVAYVVVFDVVVAVALAVVILCWLASLQYSYFNLAFFYSFHLYTERIIIQHCTIKIQIQICLHFRNSKIIIRIYAWLHLNGGVYLCFFLLFLFYILFVSFFVFSLALFTFLTHFSNFYKWCVLILNFNELKREKNLVIQKNNRLSLTQAMLKDWEICIFCYYIF